MKKKTGERIDIFVNTLSLVIFFIACSMIGYTIIYGVIRLFLE